MKTRAHEYGRGKFIATVRGALKAGVPLDPFGSLGRSLVPGQDIRGSFRIANSGYLCELQTETQILGRSDGHPGQIRVELTCDGGTFTQEDTCFNQVTYTMVGSTDLFGKQEINANNVSDTGQTTQIILSFSLVEPIGGTTLKALVDTGFLASSGCLQFYAFQDQPLAGGFVADVREAIYVGEPEQPV